MGDESSKADHHLIASAMADSYPRPKGLGFFQRVNLVILLVIVAALAAIFLPTAWDTRTLSYVEMADGTFHATITRFGKTYDIQRTETSGSGQYIEFTISELRSSAVDPATAGSDASAEANGVTDVPATSAKTLIATYSTCGHYRDEGTQMIFFEPHDFHCGWFSARLNDLFKARVSRVEFSENGAVPTFLPTDQ